MTNPTNPKPAASKASNASAHTPEPWTHERGAIYGDDKRQHCQIVACNALYDEFEANGDRIVACVNACAGLSDPGKTIHDLLDLLAMALPYVEDAEEHPAYKPGRVSKLVCDIRRCVQETDETLRLAKGGAK